MPIAAVVFDIGGVLEVNPRTGWQEQWAARLGLERREFDARLGPVWHDGEIGRATLDELERRTTEALRVAHATVSAMMDDAWGEYVGTLNRELADYFRSLRPRFKTAMLSNSFVGARAREQELYGFEDMCDAVVYSHEVGWMKPDPRIYRLTCERLGVAPEDSVFVDDVEANVDGARGVGMRAIRFVDNGQAVAEIEAALARAPVGDFGPGGLG
jgi:epoxide hydrolase-like predicted phosphatase